MKRKEILVLLGEVLGSRAAYSVASLVITITMLSGITIILRNDIRDIKNYVQSVVDGDPNYKEIHSQVRGSENVIRGNIDLETLLAKEDKKIETTSTANNISSGYDNYTPTQTITDDISNRPSNNLNNSTTGETTVSDNNSNNSNNSTNEANNSNNNSDEDKKEDVLDRSSFNGKDVMVSEGEPFNPMNALQLAATDINGKNITNKIVITENNVDTYKPGLYTVKANVTLSNENTLKKEFLVRVEPTILNLAVNDLKISKDVLEKNEHFNLTFAVKSSKSYLEVSSVNINNKDYSVKQTSSNSFFRTSNKYEVNLVAPSKAGTEKIEIKSVTMSDGTIVDINKSVNVEVLKEEAHIIDAVVKNITSEDEDMFLEYNLQDVDNVLNEAFLYLYDENDVLIQQEELEKNSKSSINLNINENGKYKVQIKGYYKTDINTISDFYNEKELFTQDLEINKFNGDNIMPDENDVIPNEEELMLMSVVDDEEYMNLNLTQIHDREGIHEIKITGSVNDENDTPPQGTISVTVPTALAFTVDRTGDLQGTSLTITNNGTEKVDVFAYEFIDKDAANGIEVKKTVDATKNRATVALRLSGTQGVANFISSKTEAPKGILDGTLNPAPAQGDGVKLVTIGKVGDAKNTGELTLTGEAGKTNDGITKGIREEFTLRLKIKKSS